MKKQKDLSYLFRKEIRINKYNYKYFCEQKIKDFMNNEEFFNNTFVFDGYYVALAFGGL